MIIHDTITVTHHTQDFAEVQHLEDDDDDDNDDDIKRNGRLRRKGGFRVSAGTFRKSSW